MTGVQTCALPICPSPTTEAVGLDVRQHEAGDRIAQGQLVELPVLGDHQTDRSRGSFFVAGGFLQIDLGQRRRAFDLEPVEQDRQFDVVIMTTIQVNIPTPVNSGQYLFSNGKMVKFSAARINRGCSRTSAVMIIPFTR